MSVADASTDAWSLFPDNPRFFQLTLEQACRVIKAAGLKPIQFCELLARGRKGKELPCQTNLEIHAFTVQKLLGHLEALEIFPHDYEPLTYASLEQLSQSVQKTRDLLRKPNICELQLEHNGLDGLTGDLNSLLDQLAVSMKCQYRGNRRTLMKRLGGSRQELFIRYHLAEAFAQIFGTNAKRSHPGTGAESGGPFARFGEAFFREIGNPVKKATIARALKPRSGEKGTGLYDPKPHALLQNAFTIVCIAIDRKFRNKTLERARELAWEAVLESFADGNRDVNELAARGMEAIKRSSAVGQIGIKKLSRPTSAPLTPNHNVP
jgi:hypothetical protein